MERRRMLAARVVYHKEALVGGRLLRSDAYNCHIY